jgi:D-glycero-D-manno-heptose 1,7-bisphosphate phosphatase
VRARRLRTDLNAVFLDRDGVINRKAPDGEYVTSWEQFEFLPGALDGLKRLAGSAMTIVITTNQRGIALGRMSREDLEDIHQRMRRTVTQAGGRIDAIYHCPHDVGCYCRKPEVGMFERAARDLRLSLAHTAVIGDSLSDMLAAERIGAAQVLVGAQGSSEVDYIARNLADAADWLLIDRGPESRTSSRRAIHGGPPLRCLDRPIDHT